MRAAAEYLALAYLIVLALPTYVWLFMVTAGRPDLLSLHYIAGVVAALVGVTTALHLRDVVSR